MSEQGPTVADVVARRLAEAGCRHAFGVPGGEVVHLIDALERAGIRFCLVRHETPGGVMAEGTFYRSGAPGVLVATVGPGVANAVNAVANAQQERVPLVLLTGCVHRDVAATYTHQVFDHRAVLAPLVKGTFELTSASASVDLDRALQLAQQGRPGPVHLDLPVSVATSPSTAPEVSVAAPATAAPIPDALLPAADALRSAERPLILAGLDVVVSGASEELRALARTVAAPVLTTYKAKGVFDERDPLSLGAAGLSPDADELLLPVVAEADVVLLAGYDPIEMRQPWCRPFGARATVIEVGLEPNLHYVHGAGTVLVGDLKRVLMGLQGLVETHDSGPRGGVLWEQAARAKAALSRRFASGGAWSPVAICEVAQRVLPPDAIVTVDTGAHRIVLSQVWRSHQPGTLLQSSALATMGAAVPLAVGALLAEPGRTTVAFVGDGGLEMVLGELATVRDLGLALPIVIFDDRSLALIELKQRRLGLPELGVNSGGTDFAAVGRALGGYGEVASGEEELAEHLGRALVADRFTLIHCPIPRGAYDTLL